VDKEIADRIYGTNKVDEAPRRGQERARAELICVAAKGPGQFVLNVKLLRLKNARPVNARHGVDRVGISINSVSAGSRVKRRKGICHEILVDFRLSLCAFQYYFLLQPAF